MHQVDGAFALDDTERPYTAFDVIERLRGPGWLVPAYTFPDSRQDLAALRIVMRNGVSHALTDLLVADVKRHVEYLDRLPVPLPREPRRRLPPEWQARGRPTSVTHDARRMVVPT